MNLDEKIVWFDEEGPNQEKYAVHLWNVETR